MNIKQPQETDYHQNIMRKNRIITVITALSFVPLMSSCGDGSDKADAYGNFEVDEITVSAKVPGEIMELNITEGNRMKKGEIVGLIDTADLFLQRLEIEANIDLIKSQYATITAQIKVLESNQKILKREIERTKKVTGFKCGHNQTNG